MSGIRVKAPVFMWLIARLRQFPTSYGIRRRRRIVDSASYADLPPQCLLCEPAEPICSDFLRFWDTGWTAMT